jgi:hypothetical protein
MESGIKKPAGESWVIPCQYECGNLIQMIRQLNGKCKAYNLDATVHKCPNYFEYKNGNKIPVFKREVLKH